jgi:vitamin B12 transporter
MSPAIKVLIAAFAFSSMNMAFAQQSIARAEEVVVTTNRIPLPLRQMAASISVITDADIQAHGNLSLADVLRQMPATSTSSNGGPGKPTSLRIRGEEGYRTLTILDGMRLSDPTGVQIGPQLEHLMSSGVGRVEMLRGPQGLSYGADAGGVVNISTRQSGSGTRGSVDFQQGRFDTQQLNGNLSGGNDQLDFFVSGSDYATEGFNAQTADSANPDADGYDNTTLHVRAGVNLSDDLRAELVHRDVDSDAEFDGCYNLTTFATMHACSSTFELSASRASLDYHGNAFGHSISYSTTDTGRENIHDGLSALSSEGELDRWEYVGSATDLPGFDLVFGADLETAENNGEGRDNKGVYAEYLSDFSESLHFTAGARHDDNDDFGTNNSYRISAAYLHDLANGDTLKFKSSYGTGFRAPSPYEIAYNRSSSAYPPASLVTLKQEKSRGWEAGVEYLTDGNLHLEAVYFDQDVEDAIFFDLSAFSGYLQDIGTSNSKGVELNAEFGIGENLELRGNYTYNDTERPNGDQRLRRPEQLANVGLSWYAMNDKLAFNAFYRVSRDSIDQVNSLIVPLKDFEVLDLSLTYNPTDMLQLFGRFENALDEEYEEVTGYNTAGAAVYVGFKVSYGL